MIKDLVPPTKGSSSPGDFVLVNNTLLFTATIPAESAKLWRTDGTAAGTQLVRDPDSESISTYRGSSAYKVWNSLLFFTSGAWYGNTSRLWRTDGSDPGTQPLITFPGYDDNTFEFALSFWPSSPSGQTPQIFSTQGRNWTATIPAPGESPAWTFQSQAALYRTDGTPGGNYPLKSGWTDFLGHAGTNTIFLSDPAYFDRQTTSAIIMSPVATLWATNGSFDGTTLLAECPAGDVRVTAQAEVEGILYLIVVRSEKRNTSLSDYWVYHESLWATDGTPGGTNVVFDEIDDEGDLAIFLGSVDGRAIFSTRGEPVYGGNSPSTIWSTEGTREGTVPLHVGSSGANPFDTINGRLMFTFYASSPPEYKPAVALWGTDGSSEGTLPIRILPPPALEYGTHRLDSGGGVPEEDGRLVFFCEEDGRRLVLWSTDGTSDGTVSLRFLTPTLQETQVSWGDSSSADVHYGQMLSNAGVVLGGNRYVFPADDGIHGIEMWGTNGTAAGTRLLRDILPGPLSSGIEFVKAMEDRLFFSANDGVTGYELWVTDGTPLGTVRATDFNPGPGGFSPNASIVHSNSLYLSADDGSGIGEELWALPLTDLPMPAQTERDILPRILNQPGAPSADDQNADAFLDIADFVRARRR